MSALDLDALEARCKDTIAEWTLVYAQSGETLPDDAVETKAARETLALITRLRAAESEASSAGVLRCKLTHEEAQTEAAGRALEMVAPGLLAEHGAIFSAVLELGARLRAAEARTAWQPIETVAIDETVLLWDPVRRGVRMGHVSIRRGCVYTHWMPLPAAPEAPHV